MKRVLKKQAIGLNNFNSKYRTELTYERARIALAESLADKGISDIRILEAHKTSNLFSLRILERLERKISTLIWPSCPISNETSSNGRVELEIGCDFVAFTDNYRILGFVRFDNSNA